MLSTFLSISSSWPVGCINKSLVMFANKLNDFTMRSVSFFSCKASSLLCSPCILISSSFSFCFSFCFLISSAINLSRSLISNLIAAFAEVRSCVLSNKSGKITSAILLNSAFIFPIASNSLNRAVSRI